MTTDAWLAIGHHLAVFTLFATLVAELALVQPPMTEPAVERVARVDSLYGLSALSVLAFGVARVVWGAKPADFYLENPMFWLKVGTFLAIGLLSIRPTMQFVGWRRAEAPPPDAQVGTIRRTVGLELALFPIIPIAAALMARGIGD
jgi:putative membrane protein